MINKTSASEKWDELFKDWGWDTESDSDQSPLYRYLYCRGCKTHPKIGMSYPTLRVGCNCFASIITRGFDDVVLIRIETIMKVSSLQSLIDKIEAGAEREQKQIAAELNAQIAETQLVILEKLKETKEAEKQLVESHVSERYCEEHNIDAITSEAWVKYRVEIGNTLLSLNARVMHLRQQCEKLVQQVQASELEMQKVIKICQDATVQLLAGADFDNNFTEACKIAKSLSHTEVIEFLEKHKNE